MKKPMNHTRIHSKLRQHSLALATAGALAFALSSACAQTQPTDCAAAQAASQNPAYPSASVKRYIKTPTGYLLVLRMGDNVFEQLEAFAICERVPSASLSAIGFTNVTFGFWDADKKAFNPKTFRNVEMASIVGSLAWKDGKPSIHAHGVAGDKTFDTYGGHILAMEVGTGSLEVTVTVYPQQLERAIDPKIGANVLGL
ncbi:PPC domain-containing DNA-binding protein [Cupriavidus ulmosensis]|uniref:PPC domain-containing DNA-binding protein n=1 Tax=Cupriavidus ulmosensis TaxID=3065913 RepID=UPI00296B4290|nr:PPC domain-containing DNA-binding protein [Cupriavidus sp. CV2]MDW3689081.1 DNA-binding protein [Cupriavidus sp. CV2]